MRHLYASDERYLTLDEIRERVADEDNDDNPSDARCAAWIAERHLEPATCNQCEGPIGEDATVPLCPRCSGTMQAHARHEQARLDWVADGSPD